MLRPAPCEDCKLQGPTPFTLLPGAVNWRWPRVAGRIALNLNLTLVGASRPDYACCDERPVKARGQSINHEENGTIMPRYVTLLNRAPQRAKGVNKSPSRAEAFRNPCKKPGVKVGTLL